MFPEPTLTIAQRYMIIEPNIITVEPHIVTASIVFGYFFVEHLFFMFFWKDYIRPFREKIKEKLRCLIKKDMKNY